MPLCDAVQLGNEQIAQMLLDYDTDINGRRCCNPLEVAWWCGAVHMVQRADTQWWGYACSRCIQRIWGDHKNIGGVWSNCRSAGQGAKSGNAVCGKGWALWRGLNWKVCQKSWSSLDFLCWQVCKRYDRYMSRKVAEKEPKKKKNHCFCFVPDLIEFHHIRLLQMKL